MSRFLIFGENHLRHLISNFMGYYHTKRSHRGLEYRTPSQVDTGVETEEVPLLSGNDLVLREALGGALKWYERKAA